ncbi:hypothetical protein O181_013018 [Austropuccinia psidii MF-1]|uniref:Uncharacterized protein n=1 Tax=Austropuccinia psidii MF-1 TaxID=1389203 RepID=A0A9Q3GMQ5_9BASI|nr:hypothetical protein [Austropuccinia psidii MF-1]
MSVQHSPPERWTRAEAVLTPTPREPLHGAPAVPQLRAHLEKGEVPFRKEGRGPRRSSSLSGVAGDFPGISSTTLKGGDEDDAVEEENSMEEEESDSTEAAPTPMGASQGTGGPTLSQYKPISHQSEPTLLAIMQQITQIMTNLQASSCTEASRLHA